MSNIWYESLKSNRFLLPFSQSLYFRFLPMILMQKSNWWSSKRKLILTWTSGFIFCLVLFYSVLGFTICSCSIKLNTQLNHKMFPILFIRWSYIYIRSTVAHVFFFKWDRDAFFQISTVNQWWFTVLNVISLKFHLETICLSWKNMLMFMICLGLHSKD